MSRIENEIGVARKRNAFQYWLRTGRMLASEAEPPMLFKYNHNHDPQNGRFTSGPGYGSGAVTVDLETGRQRRRDGSITIPLDPPRRTVSGQAVRHYNTDRGKSVPPSIEPQVNAMAKDFKDRTGKTLLVLSGDRDAHGQAKAMFDKFRAGSNGSDYSNQAALREIRDVYRDGETRKQSREVTVAAMAVVIKGQVARGIIISARMRGRAVDIRSRDFTPREMAAMRAAAAVNGAQLHPEGRPRHLHVQFPKEKR